jgi:hypothetical protein
MEKPVLYAEMRKDRFGLGIWSMPNFFNQILLLMLTKRLSPGQNIIQQMLER